MSRWLCWVLVLAVAGCHAVYPFDVDKDTGPPDAASVELDGPRTEAGIPPDTAPWPTWDFGGTMCNKLMAWGPPVQVSAPDTKPARAPSIVGIGDTFYVAFVEGKEAYVREVKATAHEPLSTLSKPLVDITGGLAAQDPWIAYNSTAKRVGVTWHSKDPSNTTTCPWNAHFQELDPAGSLSFGDYHLLSATPGHGYGPASLVFNPLDSKYVIATALEWNAACGTHTKILIHAFEPTEIAFAPYVAGAYNTTVTPAWCNRHPVIVRHPDGHYYLVRIFIPDPDCPAGITTSATLRAHVTTTSPTSWTVLPGLPEDESAAVNRPALVVAGHDVLMAYTTSTYQIKAMRYSSSLSQPFLLSGNARDPFLAHKPQEGGVASSARTVLAFAEASTDGKTTSAIGLAEIKSASFGPIHEVTKSSTAGFANWNPRTPAVAAGSNGFGVTWVENVANEQPEVFFQWVGCQP